MATPAPKSILERIAELRREVEAIVRNEEYTRNRRQEWLRWVGVAGSLYMAEMECRTIPGQGRHT